MNIDIEEWRNIEGYPYQVSSLGNIRSIDRKYSYMITRNGKQFSCNGMHYGKVLKQHSINSGYKFVCLYNNTTHTQKLVHRIVAEYFCDGYIPEFVVNHINGDKFDNRAINLEWCTQKINIEKSIESGRMNNCGSNHGISKLNEQQVLEIRDRLSKGERGYLIGNDYGISRANISRIKNRTMWKHI